MALKKNIKKCLTRSHGSGTVEPYQDR